MKKEKWQEKLKKFLGDMKKRVSEFYRSKRKLAIGLTTGVLVLVVLLGILLGNSSGESNGTTYTPVKVTRGTITQTIDAVGNIEAVPSAVLNWKTSGVVGSVNVKIGEQVNEGDVLATLVDSSVDSSILTAQNDLLSAKLSLETLKAGNMQLQTATQALAEAKRAYDKELAGREWWIVTGVSDAAIDAAREKYYETKSVFWNAQQEYEKLALAVKQTDAQSAAVELTPVAAAENTVVTQASSDQSTTPVETKEPNDLLTIARDKAYETMKTTELAFNKASRNLNYLIGNGYGNNNVVEQAFLEFDVAKATLAEAEATWQAYKDGTPYIKAAEAKVQALQNMVNSAKIIAPFNGTVTDLLASKGQTVASGEEALQLDDVNTLKITFSVSEVDVNKLAIGQEAEITFAAISGKTYHGVMEQVGRAGGDSSGVVQFYATIKMLDADEHVKPGFSASISIITNKVEDVLLVPSAAVMTNAANTKSFVLVSINGKNTPVEVEVGSRDDSYTQISSSSLKEGDTVMIVVSISGSDSASNRSMFNIMGGGFGGGDPSRMPQTSGSSNRN
jgi:RND family efflux transporter MFP subunit